MCNSLDDDMEACLRVLQAIADSPGAIRQDEKFRGLISKVYKASKRHDQQAERWRKEQEDRAIRHASGMVKIQRDATTAAALPPPAKEASRTLNEPDICYVCKARFTEVHSFYHLLCPECAEFNFRMRGIHADLKGRIALVTGGRVKIGFQTCLRLLRDGAKVIVVTRFPRAAAARFEAEPDAPEWIDRLAVYGLDLRNAPAVEQFAEHLLATEPHLDILIHNAAQTVKRPAGFYNELMLNEASDDTRMLDRPGIVRSEAPSTLAIAETSALLPGPLGRQDVLPAALLIDNEERADSRDVNSWLLRLNEVSTAELLEVQLVNSIAPFVLNSRLKPLMVRAPFDRRFIVNVSAMEGQFRRHKTVFHPHTNMAKAALNMMTRTSADDYARDGIYMNSVDTGWVTDENPAPRRIRIQEERGFYPPLDIVDGMARIYHPVAAGIIEPDEPIYGKFLKDYKECAW